MKGFILSFAVIFILVIPAITLAQTGGIVPCNGPECQACHFVQLGQNLLKWFIGIMATVIAVVVAIGGLKMVMAGGNPGEISKAREMMTNALIGFVILLSAWLIIDTVMKLVANPGAEAGGVKLGVWHTIQCVPQPERTPAVTTPGSVSVIPSTGGLVQSEALKKLKDSNISVNSNVNLEGVNQSLTETLISVCKETNENCTVTAAKNGTHQNTCHAAGTCFDVVCTSCNTDELKTFIQNTQAKGYCAVYEPGPNNTCPTGVNPCLPNVGTGAHFSFYMNSSQSPSCNR